MYNTRHRDANALGIINERMNIESELVALSTKLAVANRQLNRIPSTFNVFRIFTCNLVANILYIGY